ncbi:MAG TPA: CRTAC1 family protein [Thermoanaerobaculia bacterium]|nr:CRTAC1 family protein [Thermoanaerobaculia bacterium]
MPRSFAPLLALLLVAPGAAAAATWFRDVTAAWGIDFRHRHGGGGDFYMIETMGSGVVILDYDGDGDRDLLFLDSGPLPLDPSARPRHALLRNDGGGRWLDVTARAGLDQAGYAMGVTAGDVDGDGELDLYVTAFGPNLLLRNRGDGSYEEVGAAAGVADPSWGASATLFDADGDGDLDLYVTHYVDFSFADNVVCGDLERGLRSYCHPDVYRGLPDRFFRNRGDGTFDDATAAAGFGQAIGPGLGVVAADLDGDGWTDLYVANDMAANFLFHNRGDGTFEEVALLSGTAFSDLGRPEAGMGIAVGDVDGNGHPDLLVTHLDLQSNALYLNQGGMLFVDGRYEARIAEPSLYKVGFGVDAADFDQDGDLDVVVANGHIIHNVEQFGTGTTFAQRNQLFANRGGGVLREVGSSGLDAVRPSRGLAVGDLDGDGDLDLAINNSDAAAEVYENVVARPGRWLQIDLAGGGGVGAGGIGAVVSLASAAGAPRMREVRTASSYLSQNDLTVHLGLGDAAAAEGVEVRWPDGRRQRFARLPADHRLRLRPPTS